MKVFAPCNDTVPLLPQPTRRHRKAQYARRVRSPAENARAAQTAQAALFSHLRTTWADRLAQPVLPPPAPLPTPTPSGSPIMLTTTTSKPLSRDALDEQIAARARQLETTDPVCLALARTDRLASYRRALRQARQEIGAQPAAASTAASTSGITLTRDQEETVILSFAKARLEADPDLIEMAKTSPDGAFRLALRRGREKVQQMLAAV